MMKRILILLLAIVVLGCKENAKSNEAASEVKVGDKTSFYVGTYTNVKPVIEGGSQGIYHYQIDGEGILSKVGLAAVSESPSFLAKSNDGQYIIAVNEINTNEGSGTLESYRIEGDKLKKISTASSGGAHPCHVTSNKYGQVLVSNYTGGNVGLLNISNNGTLSDLLDVQQHQGKGSHERQEAPHAHSSWFMPNERGVVSVDLGTNELWFSEISNNKFGFKTNKKLGMKAEAGPRHLDFHPNGRFIYVLNELDNTIGLLNCDVAGVVTKGETMPMLPSDFKEFSKGADIHITEDGKFLYASNRGHNSIAIFSIDENTGELTMVGTESTRGESPRNFQLAMDDKFLVVANQKSDNIISFARDSETGKLEYISKIEAPAPVCLLF